MIVVISANIFLLQMSPKKWSKNTFGWARAEVLGALVNAVFLVALCFSITVEACKRFIEVETIHDPQLLVIVGGLGLLVNLIGLCLFHGEYVILDSTQRFNKEPISTFVLFIYCLSTQKSSFCILYF